MEAVSGPSEVMRMYSPQLDTFIKVAELGSFSKAADALFITPTAVM